MKWSENEKHVIYKNLGNNLKHGKLPSFKEIQVVLNENSDMRNRTVSQIKTWIHNNQLKKRKTDLTENHVL